MLDPYAYSLYNLIASPDLEVDVTAIARADLVLATGVTLMLFLFFKRSRNSWLLTYFIPPAVLMYLHLIGNTMQAQNVGPEWVQDHLHNLGIAFIFMLFGITPVIFMKIYLAVDYAIFIVRFSRVIMTGLFRGWTLGTVACAAYEVLMVTAWRDTTIAEGYSGQLDWLDLVAMAIGQTVMIINYLRVRPWVLKKTHAMLGLPPGGA